MIADEEYNERVGKSFTTLLLGMFVAFWVGMFIGAVITYLILNK